MLNTDTWELPFGEPAELELRTEWATLMVVPVAPGQAPRLELPRTVAESVTVSVEKHAQTVRVALDPHRSFNWFGGWDCKATLHVPRDVHAHLQTSAGSVSVRDLEGCELGIKASAGKIDLRNVYGLIHLVADAGSITGAEVGGYFDVETRAGSLRLQICDLGPGEHRIRATMGSVRLGLARGLDVSLETRTTMGSVRNMYPSRPGAPTKLVVSTEMGSVRIEADGVRRPGSWPAPATDAVRPVASKPPPPDPELERILKMVESGALSAHDADELLRAMGRV